MTKEDIETIKELLSATIELNGEYQEGWDEDIEKAEILISKLENEQIKTPYKKEYIEWRDKYFNQVDKVFEYQSKKMETYYTKRMLYKQYERAMNESPFD